MAGDARGSRRPAPLLCAALALAWAGACRSGDPESSDYWSTAIVTRAEHEEHFPLEEVDGNGLPSVGGAAHKDVDCLGCHVGDTFTEATCAGCHLYAELGLAEDPHGQALMDAEHAGKADYAFEDAKCLECHPDGSRAGGITVDNHPDWPFPVQLKHRRFAVDGLTHEECEPCHTGGEYTVVACYECHATSGAPFFPPPIDNAVVQAGGDHAGMDDFCQFRAPDAAGCGNVTTYSVDTCYDCHPGDGPAILPVHTDSGAPMSVYEHDRLAYRLDIRGGGPSNPNCETKATGCNHNACADCHDTPLVGRDYGAIDFTQYSCLGACHDHAPEVTDPAFHGTPECGTDTACYVHYQRNFTTPCTPADIPSPFLNCFSMEPQYCVGCHADKIP